MQWNYIFKPLRYTILERYTILIMYIIAFYRSILNYISMFNIKYKILFFIIIIQYCMLNVDVYQKLIIFCFVWNFLVYLISVLDCHKILKSVVVPPTPVN